MRCEFPAGSQRKGSSHNPTVARLGPTRGERWAYAPSRFLRQGAWAPAETRREASGAAAQGAPPLPAAPQDRKSQLEPCHPESCGATASGAPALSSLWSSGAGLPPALGQHSLSPSTPILQFGGSCQKVLLGKAQARLPTITSIHKV